MTQLTLTGGGPSGSGGQSYSQKVLALSPLAYWVLGEAAGATAADQISSPAQDGTYTGVTLGQTGIGDGNTAPSFDGNDDWVDVRTSTLNTAFNPVAGTIHLWAKVTNAGVWTDVKTRNACHFGHDPDNNRLYIGRTTVNNQLIWWMRGNGGVAFSVTLATAAPLTYMALGITWDYTADEFKAYYGGAQTGATGSGLTAWNTAVFTLRPAHANIGHFRQVAGEGAWSGSCAHCALWNVALTSAQMATLAVVS